MRRNGARWRTLLAVWGALALTGAGCANFVDQITSRQFRVKELLVEPEPMNVLRESTDGDARAKAMRRLKEPLKNEGTQEEQDEALNYLIQGATADPRPLCRLAAIEALGRFEDARAAAVLLNAYQSAAQFPTESANPIRWEAMSALGRKNSPEGLALLTQVAMSKAPAPAKSDNRLASFEGDNDLATMLGQSDPDQQAMRDSRLAAIRALGLTKNQQAAPILIQLLAEPDIAIRDRAHEALQAITGRKDIAKDSDAWRRAVSVTPPAASPAR